MELKNNGTPGREGEGHIIPARFKQESFSTQGIYGYPATHPGWDPGLFTSAQLTLGLGAIRSFGTQRGLCSW